MDEVQHNIWTCMAYTNPYRPYLSDMRNKKLYTKILPRVDMGHLYIALRLSSLNYLSVCSDFC